MSASTSHLNSKNYGSMPVSYTDVESTVAEKERTWSVALCSFIACLASLINGLMLSFSSPTLAELAVETDPSRRLVANETAGSLFASSGTIGAIVGSLFAWPISEVLGRKSVLIIGGFPAFFGWILIVFSVYIVNNIQGFIAILLTGRLLTGVAAGMSAGGVAVYIGEIASKKSRGFFGNWNQLFVTIGVLLGYGLGVLDQLKYHHRALIAAGLVLPFEFLMLLPTTVESPRWLYLKGKITRDGGGDYMKALQYLRGKHSKSVIREDIADIKTSAAHSNIPLVKLISMFRSFTLIWPFFLVLMLMFFQQLSGINAAVFFSSEIFEQADFDKTASNLATLGAVGGVQVVGTLMSVFLIDRLGRKTLLVLSSSGMFLSCLLLGVYFYIYDNICGRCLGPDCGDIPVCQNPDIGWLAITTMVVFIGAFSIGWGPIPWTMLSELLADNVRTLVGSVATLTNWTFAVIVTSNFESYANAVTPKFAWWTFAIFMFISVFAVVFVLPETRGLSFHEIQERFENRKVIAVSCPRIRRHFVLNCDSCV